jgi:hypothetical protein
VTFDRADLQFVQRNLNLIHVGHAVLAQILAVNSFAEDRVSLAVLDGLIIFVAKQSMQRLLLSGLLYGLSASRRQLE